MGDRVKDKVAVITGAASGIGAGTARLFVDEGASVVIADLQADAGQALSDDLGDRARFIKIDVTRENDVAAAVDLAVREFGRLDCIINNAGITADSTLLKMPEEAWDRVIDINLKGVFKMGQAVAKVMTEQQNGVIINAGFFHGNLRDCP